MKRCLSRLRMLRPPRQRGLALVCALMMMLGALILGASVARTAFASMASARLERDRLMARAAAEAALADAQADIEGGASPSSARAGWLAAGSGGFAEGCGQDGQDLGLCLPAPSDAFPVWQRVDLAAIDGAPLVPYGRYTGAVLATGAGILPARLPGYLIEKIEPATAGSEPPPAALFYRVTAIGFGTRAATRVVLQAVVRKAVPAAAGEAGGDSGEGAAAGAGGQGGDAGAKPADPAADLPADAAAGQAAAPGTGPAAEPPAGPTAPAPASGRISWREIANWSELHARAVQ